jgi:hypothetical protein
MKNLNSLFHALQYMKKKSRNPASKGTKLDPNAEGTHGHKNTKFGTQTANSGQIAGSYESLWSSEEIRTTAACAKSNEL